MYDFAWVLTKVLMWVLESRFLTWIYRMNSIVLDKIFSLKNNEIWFKREEAISNFFNQLQCNQE